MSGRMQGNSINIGGNGGNFFFIDWQLAGQDIGGNFSRINWQAYFHYNQADAQLDNGYVDAHGARRWTNGGRIKNFQSQFTTRDFAIASGTFDVGHDAAGNGSFGIGGAVTAFNSGTSGGSQGFGLPNIPRYANITSFNTSEVTDTSFRINVQTDANCNFLQYSLEDGVGWRDQFGGNFSSYSFTLSNQPSDFTRNLRVRVRRADSGLWTESGVISVRTLSQTNFLMLL